MLLHLLSDPDFNKMIIDQFEAVCPGKNTYMVFSDEELNRLKAQNITKNIILNRGNSNTGFQNIHGVLVHCLSLDSAKIVNRTPAHIPVFWSIFGIDLYNYSPLLTRQIFETKTFKYIYGGNILIQNYYLAKGRYNQIFKSDNRIKQKAIRRVDLYSTVVPTESTLAEKFLSKTMRFQRLNVGSLDYLDRKDEIPPTVKTGKTDVYVGTSASETSNHLDLIPYITQLSPDDLRLNVQLSYGGNPSYAKHVKDQFNAVLKCELNFIDSWMTKEEFESFFKRQHAFFFYSIRQQGVGAIIQALWNGSKVYMNKKNPVYAHFKSLGIIIFSVQDDLLNIENPLTFLDASLIRQNKKLLLNEYSRDTINNRTRLLIDQLLQ